LEEIFMSYRGSFLRACLFGAALSLTAGFAGNALASDPLAGDAIGLPPDLNLGLYYNTFAATGTYDPPHGGNVPHSKLDTDVNVFRYVHTFDVGGTTVGVQAVFPIVSFLGGTKVGGAHPSTNSGFAQPLLGVFAFPINDDADGRSVAVGGWVFPPISSFNKNDNVNPSENLTTYEADIGFHQILFGDPKGVNLALEAWNNVYFYSNNTNDLAGGAGGPPATLRQQPTDEVRVYLPYVVSPATGLTIAPGFFQSFGGKQTLKLHNFPVVADGGSRTEISELRFSAAMFLSPTLQIMGIGEYDVAGHGGFLTRSIQVRILKFF
jgi:hypothetical protein